MVNSLACQMADVSRVSASRLMLSDGRGTLHTRTSPSCGGGIDPVETYWRVCKFKCKPRTSERAASQLTFNRTTFLARNGRTERTINHTYAAVQHSRDKIPLCLSNATEPSRTLVAHGTLVNRRSSVLRGLFRLCRQTSEACVRHHVRIQSPNTKLCFILTMGPLEDEEG